MGRSTITFGNSMIVFNVFNIGALPINTQKVWNDGSLHAWFPIGSNAGALVAIWSDSMDDYDA